LKIYSDFIYINRYRAGRLRGNKKAAIIVAIIKTTRQMYSKQELALVFS